METKAKEKQFTIYFEDMFGVLPKIPVRRHITFDDAFKFLCEFLEIDPNNVKIISDFPLNEDTLARCGLVIGMMVVTFEEEE